MSTQKTSSSSKLAQQIWIFLRQHPMTKNTLEDISGWWSLEQGLHRSASQVKDALAELKQMGRVVVSKGRDGTIRYRGAVKKDILKGGGTK